MTMNENSSWQDYAILFDMDGVILSLKARWIDPLEEVISSIKPDYNRETIAEKSSSLLLVHGGRSSQQMLKGMIQVCEVCGLSRFQTVRAMLKLGRMLIARKKFRLIPLKGVKDTLEYLKKIGFNIALVTSASKSAVRSLRRQYPEIHEKFDFIYTRNDVKSTKPSPDQLIKALKDLNVEKDKTVMVGDFITDIIAGKGAGVKTVAVLSEYPEVNRFPLESVEPDIIINDITEIPNILIQIFHPTLIES